MERGHSKEQKIMLRIHIEWEFTSPFLQTASGILYIIDMYHGFGKSDRILLKCKVEKKTGSTGYSSIDKTRGIHSTFFESLKPYIDVMIQSYYDGMVLNNKTYAWVDDSADMSFEQWAENHDIDPESVLKIMGV